MRNKWDYFDDDTYLEVAGLRVLECVQATASMATTSYMVRLDCCDSVVLKTHRQIKDIIRRRSQRSSQRVFCSECRKNFANKPILSYDGTTPIWPKPSSVSNARLLR